MRAREGRLIFDADSVAGILAGRKTQSRRIIRTPASFKRFFTEGAGRWTGAKTGTVHEVAYGATPSNDPAAWCFLVAGDQGYSEPIRCPYGAPGGLVYVKEAWRVQNWNFHEGEIIVEYRADRARSPWRTVTEPHEDGAVFERLWIQSSEDMEAAGYRYDDPDPEAGGRWPHDEPEPDAPTRWRSPVFMPRWAARTWLRLTDVRAERLHDITEADAIAEGVGSPLTRDCKVPRFARRWDAINAKRAPWDSNPYVWALTFERTEAPA